MGKQQKTYTREFKMEAVQIVNIKPSPCLPYQRLIVPRQLVIGLHRDGFLRGAGDGARTRDSLLGRQGVPELPSALYESAFEAD